MFIIIPLIFIFLLFSYLQINDDVSFELTMTIYGLMIAIAYFSYVIFKKVKNDFKVQERNTIIAELNHLQQKLSKETDEKLIHTYKHKIEMLQEELAKKE
jgi:Ca2+/Na+ antiporter